MSENTEPTKELICPECMAVLPEIRSKHPWCECGWSSETDNWVLRKVHPRLRPMMIRDRTRAEKLSRIDKQAASLLSHPWGKRLYGIYLAITVFLCIPVLTLKYVLYGIVLAAWGYTVYIHSTILISIMTIVVIGIIVYQWLTRPEKDPVGITLDRQSASKLFELLDEISLMINTSPVSIVRLKLESGIGINQKLDFFHKQVGTELNIGLVDLLSTNMCQFKSVIAHELGHVKNKDTMLVSLIIFNALNTLNNWLSPGPGVLALLYFLPLYIIFSLYFRLLVFVSRWAMRRQEYLADRLAAQHYGKKPFQLALISLCAGNIGFEEYVPLMIQNIENNFDRRDFYAQFTDYWKNLREENRQEYHARAVASFNMLYDTHPTYKDRISVLNKLENLPEVEIDDRPASLVLPNAGELGRELTIQIYKNYRL